MSKWTVVRDEKATSNCGKKAISVKSLKSKTCQEMIEESNKRLKEKEAKEAMLVDLMEKGTLRSKELIRQAKQIKAKAEKAKQIKAKAKQIKAKAENN